MSLKPLAMPESGKKKKKKVRICQLGTEVLERAPNSQSWSNLSQKILKISIGL
jgi:hypothetical protein